MACPTIKLMREYPAVIVLVTWAGGIIIDYCLGIVWWHSLSVLVFSLAAWWWMQRRGFARHCLVVGLLSAVFWSGALWHHARWHWVAATDLSRFGESDGTPACVAGKILGEPRFMSPALDQEFDPFPSRSRTQFLFRPTAIRDGGNWVGVHGRTLVMVYEDVQHVDVGDMVVISGILVSTEVPTSPGQFDYQDFARANHRLSTIHVDSGSAIWLQRQAEGRGFTWNLSAKIRTSLRQLIAQYLSESEARLVAAILLGYRENLAPEHREKFVVTGTAHLLAISGLHVGILASLFLLLYRIGCLSRQSALVATICFVVFYAWLVEFKPPVVRATILLTMVCLGRLIGREGHAFNLLAVAALIVLAINPHDLFGLGPQLSFLAVATLVWFRGYLFPPAFEDPLSRLIWNTRPGYIRLASRVGRRCRQAIYVSALIWLVGLPLVAFHFHLVTPVAVVANPVVLLPMGLALMAGMGVVVFGSWFTVAAESFGWVASKCLQCVEAVVDVSASWDHGHWWTIGPSLVSVAIFYGLLPIIVSRFKENLLPAFCIFWVCWCLLCWVGPQHVIRKLTQYRDGTCTFIDVRHGVSVLLQLPDGVTVLYDAGSLTSSRFALERVSGVLWSQGVSHLDSVIVSHADLDHYNAIPRLLERFSVDAIWVGPAMMAHGSDQVSEFRNAVESKSVPVKTIFSGCETHSTLGGESMTVLSPPKGGAGGNDNSESVVGLVQFGMHRVLLTGDIEHQGLEALLARPRIECDIVLMPHHGSRHSCPQEFVRWCNAEHAIISASPNKIDRDVVQSLRNNGCAVYSTADSGTLRYSFESGSIAATRWSAGNWRRVVK